MTTGDRHDWTAGRITVALVNDYELVLRGTAEMLRPYRDRIEVVELDIARNPGQRVDVALFDPYGHAQLGLDRVWSLTRDPKVGCVAIYTWTLTAEQRDAAQAAGAQGIIAKSTLPDELVGALLEIAAGGQYVSSEFSHDKSMPWPGQEFGLTLRESEVAALLSEGLRNREIARSLWISENTVKTHLKAIFQKTASSSRAQAVVRIGNGPSFTRRRIA